MNSPFTNVSCNIVLDSLDRRFFCINENCKIPFNDIRDSVRFLFDYTFVVFNDKFYKQIYGTPMGSPISQFFADIVMDNLENYCLSVLNIDFNCIPVFYYRYVDDIILCVRKKHIDMVIDTFNSYVSNLQFTFELEQDERINFLDMTLIRNNNMIITNWFRKQTSSDRVINYSSNHPTQQKKNIVFNYK